VFEINNDAKMKRTMRRPLPSGRVSSTHAAMWATSAGIAGTTLLASRRFLLYLCIIYIYI
jgi:heme o synthase